MSEQNWTSTGAREAAAELARLSDEFSVPLGVLDQVVTRWVNQTDGSPP